MVKNGIYVTHDQRYPWLSMLIPLETRFFALLGVGLISGGMKEILS